MENKWLTRVLKVGGYVSHFLQHHMKCQLEYLVRTQLKPWGLSFFLSFFSQLYLLKKRKKERLGRENSCFRAATSLTWWTQALPANHLFTNMHCPWILSYNIWRLLFFKSALWKNNFHKSTPFKYTVQGV